MAKIGEWRDVSIGGRLVPGVVVGETAQSTVQVPSKDPARNGALVNIPVQRADIITLRETNPALGPVRKYLTMTSENLRFTFPRFDAVVGLDATEDGDKISLRELVALTAASTAEFQAERLAAQAEPEIAL